MGERGHARNIDAAHPLAPRRRKTPEDPDGFRQDRGRKRQGQAHDLSRCEPSHQCPGNSTGVLARALAARWNAYRQVFRLDRVLRWDSGNQGIGECKNLIGTKSLVEDFDDEAPC